MLDLFSGIGGFSLAAKWVWGDDLDIVGFCEIEPYAQKVLKKNFPGVPIHEDIKKLRGDEFNEIDLITGGFPCQDISQAGKGAGIKEGTRSGLWFELLRVIGDIRPRFALIENVPMLTVRGGTGVIEDLTEIGYDAEWQIIGADDVGARHRRKRIWIVAYPMCGREVQDTGEVSGTSPEIRRQHKSGQLNGHSSILAHSDKAGNRRIKLKNGDWESRDRQEGKNLGSVSDNSSPDSGKTEKQTTRDISNTKSQRNRRESRNLAEENGQESGRRETTAKPFEETGNYWSIEPKLGRVANGVPSRVDRLKGLGNAIVPQVAALIMDRIKAID